MRMFGRQEQEQERMSPEMASALLGAAGEQTKQQLHRIGEKEIAKAGELLQRYKDGKANLERRIVEDELWWELRHWETMRSKTPADRRGPEPTSGWLFNAIINKHADAMDNYPEPVVLPREPGDEESAKTLSEVLPVVLESNDFEQTYSDNWWEKLKHGTAAYGVFWNQQKENGLGDVDVKAIDLLKLFWEPGVTDLQKSRNLFLVELVDTDLLEQQYPQYKDKLGGGVIDVKQYLYDDAVDTADKSVVVDWYYKVMSPGGRTLLHYAKFVGNTLLFASENEPEYQDTGWYDDGKYPVVLDVMFPEKGTPVGFGYVAVCKDPQMYIDKLSGNILESSMMGTKKRFFASGNTAVNKEQFLDWREPIVEVEGELDETRLREITVQPPSEIYMGVLQMKIEEMKDTAANRDVNAGGSAGSGVTAAAAIAALQEAGNKVSRDMIAASYRSHVAINSMVIDRMAQFYDETRTFRITGDAAQGYSYVELNNAKLGEQSVGMAADGSEIYRKPVFDLKVRAQKRNPFSRMEQNERAKELYGMGFFNPERAQEAGGALEMMDFEGIDKVKEQVQQGQTLMNICQQMSQQMQEMAALLQQAGGVPSPGGIAPAAAEGAAGETGGELRPGSAGGVDGAGGNKFATGVMEAQTPMTGYGERLAKRSGPSLEG